MNEPIVLKRRNGESHAATADIVRPSETARVAQAAGLSLAGLIVGGFTILIPIAHFVLPWMIPLVCFFIAAYIFGKKGDVLSVSGECPKCAQAITLPGGPIEASMWRKCPSCEEPLQIVVEGSV